MWLCEVPDLDLSLPRTGESQQTRPFFYCQGQNTLLPNGMEDGRKDERTNVMLMKIPTISLRSRESQQKSSVFPTPRSTLPAVQCAEDGRKHEAFM